MSKNSSKINMSSPTRMENGHFRELRAPVLNYAGPVVAGGDRGGTADQFSVGVPISSRCEVDKFGIVFRVHLFSESSRLSAGKRCKNSQTIPDADLLIDIDLSILGQPPERFRDYEQAIRAEYAWVPEATFVQKRREILAGFLERPAIYHAEWSRTRYESIARANLLASLARLRASSV
jgi:hypothetical protein